MSRFQYQARTPEQIRERAARAIGGRDTFFTSEVQFFTPRVGDNTVRILPPPSPEKGEEWGHYGVNLAVHYGIGADQSAYLCPSKMKDEPCPLCEERERASSAGEEELADALRPNYRVAVYVVDRAQENKGPMLWNVPAGVDKDIIKLCIDPTTGETLPVDDPNDGYDLTFTREGEGLKTKYKGIQFARRASPLADDVEVAESWLAYIVEHPIDECLVYRDYDYIAKVYEGQVPPGAGDQEDTQPTATPAAGRRVIGGGGRATGGDPRVLGGGTPAGSQRGAAAPARTRIAPRRPAPPPAEPAQADAGLPTWEELEQMGEEDLASLGEEAGVAFPDEGFDSLEDLRTYVAEQLGIAPEPKPEPPKSGAAGGWRDRLNKMRGGK